MQKKIKPLHHLGVFLLLLAFVFFVQYVGALFSSESLDTWYHSLNKPKWTFEREVFAPVWTFLYLIVAGVAYFLWKEKDSPNRKKALFFWGAQLFFNGLWSFFFFYLQNIFLAMLDLALIIFLVFVLFHYAKKVSNIAVVLLLPYTIWLLYAFFLNLTIWMQN